MTMTATSEAYSSLQTAMPAQCKKIEQKASRTCMYNTRADSMCKPDEDYYTWRKIHQVNMSQVLVLAALLIIFC